MSAMPPFWPNPGMTTGQILNRVFRLLRANFKLLFGIAGVPSLAFMVIYGAFLGLVAKEVIGSIRGGQIHPDVTQLTWTVLVGFIVNMAIQLVVFAVYLASASYAAVQVDRGVGATFREAYGVASTRAGHYLLLMLTIYSVTFLPPFLLEVPLILAVIFLNGSHAALNPALILLVPLDFLLIFGAFIAGALVALRLSLAFPASVFELLTVRKALRRSWTLTRGAVGRIFVAVLVIYAAVYALSSIVIYGAIAVGGIAMFAFSHPQGDLSKQAIIALVVFGILVYVLLIAICSVGSWAGFATSFAVIYNDQLRRFELPVSTGARA